MSISNLKIIEQIYGKDNVYSFSNHTFGEVRLDVFDYIHNYYVNSRLERGWKQLKGLVTGLPVHIDAECLRIINNVIVEKEINDIFIDGSYMGNLAKYIKLKFPEINIVTFFHDVVGDLSIKWMLNKPLHMLPFMINTIINEKNSVKYSDFIITLNSRDSGLVYKKYNRKPTMEMPIILDDHFENRRNKNKNYLLFVGVDYFPNVDGIRWFIKEVLSFVNYDRLIIVGRGMERYKEEFELLSSKVEVEGTVDNLNSYYENASIIVAPIFQGGGMKVKVAEALMFGKMVIGAREALEGYNVEEFDGIEANSKEEFISAINLNIHASDYYENNRQYFLRNFSFTAGVKKMALVMRK